MSNFMSKYDLLDPESQDQLLKKGINDILDKAYQQELSKKLEKKHHVKRSKPTKRVIPLWKTLRIAAALAMLVAVYTLLNRDNINDLSATYIEAAFIHPGETKGVGDLPSRSVAIASYDAGAFDTAHEQFNAIADPTAQDKLYGGISALKAGMNKEAIRLLADLVNTKDNPWSEEARWYLSLALIRNKEIAGARTLLSEIEPGDWKYAEATKLLKELND